MHPFNQPVPIEYICETTNDLVNKFSFRLPKKTSLISERTNLLPNEFLRDVVWNTSQRDTITHQLGFIESIERLYDISDSHSTSNTRLKILLAEFDRIQEHMDWFHELFSHSSIPMVNIFLNLKNKIRKILANFFHVQKNNLSTCIEVGIINLEWNLEDNSRLQTILNEIIEMFGFIKDKILTNLSLKALLFAVGTMDTRTALKTGTVGPIARSSAVDQDLRIDDPYWDYLSFEFKLAQSYDQDLYGLVRVLLNEISVSFEIINSILAEEFIPKPENTLDQSDPLSSGLISARLETSKGPAIYSIECNRERNITGYGFTSPGLTNLHSLETRLRGAPTNHIHRILHAYNITDLTLIRI